MATVEGVHVGITVKAPAEAESFGEFYRTQYHSAVALALAITGDRAAAEDIAQEAFLRLLRHRETIDDPVDRMSTVGFDKAAQGGDNTLPSVAFDSATAENETSAYDSGQADTDDELA